MCILFIAYHKHPKHPLIVLANRDEFYDRPTAPAARWADHPTVTAGRDLVAGGTWLGIANGGRFAAVTNYRDANRPQGTHSRGRLVADFLIGGGGAEEYIELVADESERYSGFNLVVADAGGLHYFSNASGEEPRKLDAGVYGLSNHLLNTPWPKVSSGVAAFERFIGDEEISRQAAFALLSDENLASDNELPDTGIGLDKERLLSSIFIRSPIYGTRSSTLVLADQDRELSLEERVFV